MTDRYERLADRIEQDQLGQYPTEPPWELLVGILGDIHELQKDGAEEGCKVADAVYARIEGMYESNAEGFFDRWWKRYAPDESTEVEQQ